jgi:hypothetical protein
MFRIFVLFLLSAVAQNSFAQMQVVGFAGPQITSAQYKVKDEKQSVDYKMGVTAGGGLKVVFDNQFYFFPALYYSLKGYKVILKDGSFPPAKTALNNNTTIHTVELCPMFQVDFNKRPSHLFVRFGAAVDFAVSGRESFDSVNTAIGQVVHVSRPMKFAFTEYGRYSASANLHFGYETGSRLLLWAFYNHGIGSMNNADNGPTILHRIGGIAFGYIIGRQLK